MRILILFLIISILGNFIGIYLLLKHFKKNTIINELKNELTAKHQSLQLANSYLPNKIVFIHHSVGRNWLKDGGLLDSLTAKGFAIQSATNRIGCDFAEETDMHNWVPKFQNNMDRIIHYDIKYSNFFNDSVENDIIMFKPCYPNSNILADDNESNSDNQQTLNQFKSYFADLKDIFSKYPEKKFIYVTAPPMVPNNTTLDNAARAREFNNWLQTEYLQSYKKETSLNNLYIFDLFEVLANEQSVLKEEFRRSEADSHPNKMGSQTATMAFLKFLEKNNDIKNKNI